MKQCNNETREKGVSLYLGLTIMAILLAISLGLASIFIAQIGMVKGMGYSVIAFNAADTGCERGLYALYKEGASLPFSTSGSVGNASYSVNGYSPGTADCPSPPNDYYCIKSVGVYQQTKRSIEISR